jgi:isoquinoline 1-oxidoreductase subunit alpha
MSNWIQVNGQKKTISLHMHSDPLLWVLREDFGLIGTKFGCGQGVCGACTVHLNGAPIRSCLTQCAGATGLAVTTIEGLAYGNLLHPVQRAWTELRVAQCGYCQAGQMMSAAALLETTANPTDAQIDDAMVGNLCRCGTYERIRAAIKLAAVLKREAL